MLNSILNNKYEYDIINIALKHYQAEHFGIFSSDVVQVILHVEVDILLHNRVYLFAK